MVRKGPGGEVGFEEGLDVTFAPLPGRFGRVDERPRGVAGEGRR
jgi:hypothetical protein